MSTTCIINFQTQTDIYPLFVRKDGYPKGILSSLGQLKTFCTTGLLKWEDVYSFIEKYSNYYHIEWFYDQEKFLQVLPNFSAQDIFLPYDDGYGERAEGSGIGYGSHTYKASYKLKKLEADREILEIHQKNKSECQRDIINFLFNSDYEL